MQKYNEMSIAQTTKNHVTDDNQPRKTHISKHKQQYMKIRHKKINIENVFILFRDRQTS